MKQVSILIPEDLRRRFKAQVAIDGTSMQAKLEEWIQTYVDGGER